MGCWMTDPFDPESWVVSHGSGRRYNWVMIGSIFVSAVTMVAICGGVSIYFFM